MRLCAPYANSIPFGTVRLSLLTVLSLFLFVLPVHAQDHPQLTNLPTVYVETLNGWAITSRTNYTLCTLTYVDGEETVTYDSVEIRGRGNSTWNLAKKPYRIKFPQSIRFLGKDRAKARSWTLLANHADKSLIRNAVAAEVGTFVGQPFTAAARFVDLVLNGTYLGNYQISDQINVDKRRVDIVEQEEVATEESNISGGYLLELGGFSTGDPVWVRTSRNIPVSIKSPDEDVVSTAQKNYVRNYLNDYESRLFSSNYRDPVEGYRAVTDSATLVSWYIATEVTANPDGLWSTYVYKEQDDPCLRWGPLWDFDIAFNNCNRIGDVTWSFMTDAGFGSEYAGMWVKRMISDPWFNWAVNKGWQRFVDEGIEDHLLAFTDSLALLLDESQALNYQKYRINQHVYNEIYLFSTYQEYIDDLKAWISSHIEFLNYGFASRVNGEEEPLDPFHPTEGWYYRIVNRGSGLNADLDGTALVMWGDDSQRTSRHWIIREVGDHFQLINRADGLALADPSPTSATGTQLTVATPDDTDNRQLWDIVTINENGNYNLVNVGTKHAANNSGGGKTNGNPVISYTSDDRNATSENRQWRIVQEEAIPDYIHEEVRANFAEVLAAADAFLSSLTPKQIGTRGGLYSPVAVDALRSLYAEALALNSNVEDDYIQMTVRLRAALTLASTPNTITKIQQQLVDLVDMGDSILQAIDPAWMGSEPLMYSQQACNALRTYLDEIERVQPYYSDDDARPYADSLAVLTTAATTLIEPSVDDAFYLVNSSGHYLNATEGLLFADPLTCTSPSAWHLTHVNNTPNVYYLSTDGGFLYMKAGGGGMPGINPTRRSFYGKLTITPCGPGTFTITTIYGLLGASSPITDGTPCTGAATDNSTTTWKLRRAGDDVAVRPIPLTPLEYAVKLDLDNRIIRFVTDDDASRLTDIPVSIYTTGGRLLYTFRADQPQSIADLPSGTYILSWTIDNQQKSIHFTYKP